MSLPQAINSFKLNIQLDQLKNMNIIKTEFYFGGTHLRNIGRLMDMETAISLQKNFGRTLSLETFKRFIQTIMSMKSQKSHD